MQIGAMREHLASQPHQCIYLNRRCLVRLRPDDRFEFKLTHSARAGVAQALDGAEAVCGAALGGKPSVDQRVAKICLAVNLRASPADRETY